MKKKSYHDRFTRKATVMRSLFFKIYRAIPFVFELRTLLDWVCQKVFIFFFCYWELRTNPSLNPSTWKKTFVSHLSLTHTHTHSIKIQSTKKKKKQTTLDLWETLKLEDIYATIYIVKVCEKNWKRYFIIFLPLPTHAHALCSFFFAVGKSIRICICRGLLFCVCVGGWVGEGLAMLGWKMGNVMCNCVCC